MVRSIILLLVLMTGRCYAQDKVAMLPAEAGWNEGTVMLNDGSELTGLISYNDKTGVVSFKNGSTSKVMTSRNLMGFEYFDPLASKQRIYYSLEIPDDETGVKAATIFEVIRMFKSFAVLSRIEPVEFKKKTNTSMYNPMMGGIPLGSQRETIKISQRETIWFLPGDGEPTLYLEYIARETDRKIDLSHDKKKLQDKDIFERCTGSAYPAIEAYAKANGLSFNDKDDLMKMLDFYETQVVKK